MFEKATKAKRAFGSTLETWGAIVRVSASLEEGRKPSQADLKKLDVPPHIQF